MSKPVKVLFIVGAGRSGSTLLHNILGQFRGTFGAGELRFLWDRGLQDDDHCACGELFSECPRWSKIVATAFGNDLPDPARMTELRERVRNRHMWTTFLPAAARQLQDRQREYTTNMARLYPAISEVTDCDLIVDSSKYPSHGFMLQQIPQIELHVLHLVRDARAVSYSWQVKKKYGTEHDGSVRYMDRFSPLRTALWWISWNRSAELIWGPRAERYRRWTYEAFVTEPERHLTELFQWVEVPANITDVVQNGAVEMKPLHCFSGNPSRFNLGAVPLKQDQRWQTEMARRHRALVTALTWRSLRRYGYPLWPKGREKKWA